MPLGTNAYDTHGSGQAVDLRIKISKSYSGPGLYGTATAVDIIHVTLAAVGFCVAAGAVTYLVVQMVLSLK